MSRRTDFTDTRLLDLIRLAYAAALDERQWSVFLNTLPGVFGGTAALLMQHDMVSHGHVNWSSNLDPAGLALYQEYYHQVDPWAKSGHAKQHAVAGAILPDEALLPREALKRTEFFEFVQQNDMARVMVSTANRDHQLFSGLSVYRSERDSPFDDDSRTFMKALLPHVALALRVHSHVSALSARLTATADALDQVAMAVLFVDGNARVVSMNRAAERLIASRDGLFFNRGELRAATPADTRHLRAALASVTAMARGEHPTGDGYLTLARRASARPLQVRLTPLVSSVTGWRSVAPNTAVACVFIVDPDAEVNAVRAEALRVLFQLTPAEARVAARLADGLTPNEAADVLGLTRNTVRWYVKQILAKVGVSTQAQLMRVLLRAPVADG